MTTYDKELINSRITEVCDYYLPGEGRKEGQKRRLWDCPECGGDRFAASSDRGIAGCLSAGCEVPKTRDAVGIIAYFEGLEQSGADFMRSLEKGYEILGIPEPEDEGKPKQRSSKARSIAPSGNAATDGSVDGPYNPPARPDSECSPSVETKKDGAEPQGSATTTAQEESGPPGQQQQASVLGAAGFGSSLALLQSLHHPHENGNGNGGGAPPPEAVSGESVREEPQEEHEAESLDPQEKRELVDRVYRAFLELCPLVDRDRQWWLSRGVSEQMMERCGFGSLWRERCWEVLAELERRFGREELASVPGFYVSKSGRVHTNLYDDYTLIPYYDRDGYVTMVQGRVPGQPEEGKPKYMAPVNSGLHLYVPPGYRSEQVVAFCEGAVGAIVAAQSGIPVAAITGYQCYRIAGGRGEADGPLTEHERTDFGGRKVLYLPDEDVKPKTKASVLAEAPKAARALIEAHGGTAYIAQLPEGYTDLDEWLLALEPDERLQKFAELMKRAVSPEQWEGTDATRNGQPQHDGHSEKANQGEHVDTAATGEKQTSNGGANKRGSKSGKVRRSIKRSEPGEDGREQPTEENHSSEDGEDTEELSEPGEETEETGGQSPSAEPKVKTPEPQPRTYKKVAKTNIGEFMVALFCGLIIGVGFLLLLVLAAPAWGPTSSLAPVPAWIRMLMTLFITAVVIFYVCRKLYLRRCMAIRKHLAGKR